MIAGSGCIARKPQADIVAILQAWELKNQRENKLPQTEPRKH